MGCTAGARAAVVRSRVLLGTKRLLSGPKLAPEVALSIRAGR